MGKQNARSEPQRFDDWESSKIQKQKVYERLLDQLAAC